MAGAEKVGRNVPAQSDIVLIKCAITGLKVQESSGTVRNGLGGQETR